MGTEYMHFYVINDKKIYDLFIYPSHCKKKKKQCHKWARSVHLQENIFHDIHYNFFIEKNTLLIIKNWFPRENLFALWSGKNGLSSWNSMKKESMHALKSNYHSTLPCVCHRIADVWRSSYLLPLTWQGVVMEH